MITHTKISTFIATLQHYEPDEKTLGRYFASWDLYRCDVTGLFFKFGHEGERGKKVIARDGERRGEWVDVPDDPPHRVYLREREVVRELNLYANDI